MYGCCSATPTCSPRPRADAAASTKPKAMRNGDSLRTIGLIGGMSWESTVPYYRVINETVREMRGGLHSARIALLSVDFHDVEAMQRDGRWAEAGDLLAQAARTLEVAGADFLVLCTNTMHKVAAAIERGRTHSAAAHRRPDGRGRQGGGRTHGRVARHALHDGGGFLSRPAAYAARTRRRRARQAPIATSCTGSSTTSFAWGASSNRRARDYRRIVDRLVARGAEGIIFGCTEISMLVGPDGCVACRRSTRR